VSSPASKRQRPAEPVQAARWSFPAGAEAQRLIHDGAQATRCSRSHDKVGRPTKPTLRLRAGRQPAAPKPWQAGRSRRRGQPVCESGWPVGAGIGARVDLHLELVAGLVLGLRLLRPCVQAGRTSPESSFAQLGEVLTVDIRGLTRIPLVSRSTWQRGPEELSTGGGWIWNVRQVGLAGWRQARLVG
jgi:hypothetical protein